MLFPTLSFAMFFVVVLGVGWRINNHPKAWKLFMLAASYFFYAAWDWRFLGLIMLSTVVNSAAAVAVHSAAESKRRPLVVAGVAFNLGLLGYFKYAGFFVSALIDLLKPVGLAPTDFVVSVALPIAISFFTFQAISYIVDVYRRETEPFALVEVALYLSFFPHLVAGPIVRAKDFVPQLRRRRNPRAVDVSRAARLIGRGLVKKVIVATTVANFVDPVFAAPGKYHAVTIVVAVWGYAIQLYCDFSGYTDMAIGLALLLGFKFPQNFDRPYAAVSIQQFWRRWHITLSDWLRDYLYIPLGGNKTGHTNRNLVITMALGGLWHGASWSFVVWGAYHGVGLAIERMVGEDGGGATTLRDKVRLVRRSGGGLLRARVAPVHGQTPMTLNAHVEAGMGSAPTVVIDHPIDLSDARPSGGGSGPGRNGDGPVRRWVRRHTGEIEFDEEWERLRASLEVREPSHRMNPFVRAFFVFQFVCVGWVFFRAPDLSAAFSVFARFFGGWTSGEMWLPSMTVALIVGALIAQFVPRYVGNFAEYRFSLLKPLTQGLLFGVLMAAIQALGPQGVAPYIYFRF